MSVFNRRVGLAQLAEFCDRFGTALRAGIDPRRSLDGELVRAPARVRAALGPVRQALEQGETLGGAFAASGSFFPPLFLELLEVGERTGKVDEVLLRQAAHYRHLNRLRWVLIATSAWPVIQLTVAIFVIGALILVLGTLVPGNQDILGFGLVGWSGLARYVTMLTIVAVVAALVWSWCSQPSQVVRIKAILIRFPALAGYFTADAMARFCWTLAIVDEAGMDLQQGLRAALRGSGNQRYIGSADAIVKGIGQGRTLAQTFAEANIFPHELVAGIDVGEQSGRLSETLQTLSEQYQKQAQSQSYVLVAALSMLIWGLVAVMIIFMIFRIAGFITGTYEELSRPV